MRGVRLELRGITKRFPGIVANERRGPLRRAGRDPRPARRERRRQVHADERPLRPLPGRRGRDPHRRRGGDLPRSRRRHRRRHRHGPPALHARAGVHGHRERHARAWSPRAGRSACWTAAAARGRVVEISERYGLDVDPDAIVEDLPVGVQQRVEIIKALYRDADLLILDEPTAVLTPQEDRRAVRRSCARSGERASRSSSSPTSSSEVHGRRRPDHGAAPRPGRRARPTPADATRKSLAVPDGRPRRRARGRQGAGPARRARPRGEGLSVQDDRGHVAVDGRRPSRSAPARSWPWPGCRATARPSSSRRSPACGQPAPARSVIGGEDVRSTPRQRVRGGRRPRARGPPVDGLAGPASRSPTTWCSTPTTAARSPRASVLQPRRDREPAEELVEQFDVRTAVGRSPTSARCRAATSRRSSWRASSRDRSSC